MSLYKDPVTTLLNVVGQQNGITLNPEDYDFGTPQVNNTGQYPNQNTHVTITANNTVAPYQGSIQIFYNRLDLADLPKLVELKLQAPDVVTSHDIIGTLNDRYGLNLTTTDLVDLPAEDLGDFKNVTLTAEEDSLGWIGSIVVRVTYGDIPLENYLLNTALPGFQYPTPYATLPFAQFYSYWRDFSEHVDYLKTIEVGQAIPAQLATILTAVTGDTWTQSGYSQFSLGGAVIKYAGLTVNDPMLNDNYDYAIVIGLNHDDAFGISGDLILHFSDPVDPFGEP